MKIGVITYWTTNSNYGQLLQCYALQHALESLGHEAYIIRYDPFTVKNSLFRRLRTVTPTKLISLVTGEHIKKRVLLAHATKMDKLRRFDSFRADYLTIGERLYSSLRELRANPPDADVYICGSDQVWNNPQNHPETPAWFLDFGNVPRIAYAASISRNLKQSEIQSFKRHLDTFSAISLREASATELCRSLGYEQAKTVLDPTLLIGADDYPIGKEVGADNKYIFAYIVNVVERDSALWDYVNHYASNRGLDVLPVYSSGYSTCVEFLSDEYKSIWPTVPQWLALLVGARSVVTTSFHGVAMSVVMHRPFLSVPLGGEKASADARVRTLLEAIGLEDRILVDGFDFANKMDTPIDWGSVDKRLSELRAESIDFLVSALAGCGARV